MVAAAYGPLNPILHVPGYTSAIRPNTPVLPFRHQSSGATFIDPTVHISNGIHVVLATSSYVAPYAVLDGTHGYIKIGEGSTIADNARLIANPSRTGTPIGIQIGDQTLVGDNATVMGPSVIGAYGADKLPTYVGPGALIQGATIEPGAYVSALARVGPGLTIPTGIKVLPGKNITTEAEATDPALGKVTTVTADDLDQVTQELAHGTVLATGYATLYQGNSATGASPIGVTGVNNGNLSAVLGASYEPGPPTVPFEPGRLAPTFISPHSGQPVTLTSPNLGARVIGQVNFGVRPSLVVHRLGKGTVIRADDGQPINIASVVGTGTNVVIRAPLGGRITIGQGFRADSGAMVFATRRAATDFNTVLGDQVLLQAGSIVGQSTIGSNSTIGPRAVVLNSTLPPGTTVPGGTIIIDNAVFGTVEW